MDMNTFPTRLLGFGLCALIAILLSGLTAKAAVDLDRDPAWAEAYKAAPMNVDETKAFMKELAQYVFDHHMKKTDGSPQGGHRLRILSRRERGEAGPIHPR